MQEQRTNYSLAAALSDVSVEMHRTAELMQAADCRERLLGQLIFVWTPLPASNMKGGPGFRVCQMMDTRGVDYPYQMQYG